MPVEGAPTRVHAVEIHQDEVLTGEAVALDVQPIGYFLRALGVLIDMVLGVIVLVLFALVTTWLAAQGLLDETVMPILVIIVLVIVMVVIPTVVETASRGRSLGKLAVGGRIVRADGGATGFRHAFIRALVGVFELWFTLGAVAALVGAFTPRSQRLGDLLAGTYSERTRTPRLPADPPGMPPDARRLGVPERMSRGCPIASRGASRSSSATPTRWSRRRARGSQHPSPKMSPRTCRRCPRSTPRRSCAASSPCGATGSCARIELETQRVGGAHERGAR